MTRNPQQPLDFAQGDLPKMCKPGSMELRRLEQTMRAMPMGDQLVDHALGGHRR